MATIIIVDDDVDFLESMNLALVANGHECRIAENGSEAMAQLSDRPSDAMFLDLRMPRYDGMYVIERYQDVSPSTAIIVLTAHATIEAAQAAIRAGVKDFLLKPVSVEEAEAALQRALGRVASHVVFGPFRLCTRTGALTLDGEQIHLTPITAKILTELAHRLEGVTYRELAEAVYRQPFTEYEAYTRLRSHMTNLRSALSDAEGQSVRYIFRDEAGRFKLAIGRGGW